MGKELSFPQIVLDNKVSTCKNNNNKLGLLSYTISKNSKWINNLNIITKTIRLLGKKRVNLYDSGFGNEFLDITPKRWTSKETDTLDLSKSKILFIKGYYQESKNKLI